MVGKMFLTTTRFVKEQAGRTGDFAPARLIILGMPLLWLMLNSPRRAKSYETLLAALKQLAARLRNSRVACDFLP